MSSVANRAAVAAVASGLQVVKRVRFGMAGRYIGQLLFRRGHLTDRRVPGDPGDRVSHVGRMAIV
ncbi:hypothetical protein GCM10023086_41490 [Streptomyces venetus]|uniref:Uncharacterized protein n=1 Tax=Streptomyces venetus TaxID=1701086 RepID=A0ABP8G6Q3_9ACTN